MIHITSACDNSQEYVTAVTPKNMHQQYIIHSHLVKAVCM